MVSALVVFRSGDPLSSTRHLIYLLRRLNGLTSATPNTANRLAAVPGSPSVARVVSLTERPGGMKVHLEVLPGDPGDYADALRRAHLLSA